jgi:hypothetical protein
MAALANADRLEWVVHAHPLAGAKRRLYIRHRPFAPGCPQYATQRPFGSSRRSSLTGHYEKILFMESFVM